MFSKRDILKALKENVKFSNLRRNRDAIESFIVISTGIFLHLNNISILRLQYNKTPILSPNVASTLVIFSILCIITKLRTIYTQNLTGGRRYSLFTVEFILILYMTDLLLQTFWKPCLSLIQFSCYICSRYVRHVCGQAFFHASQNISSWIQNDGFYIVRFGLAALLFLIMLKVTGAINMMLFIIRAVKRKVYEDNVHSDNFDNVDLDSIGDADLFVAQILARSQQNRLQHGQQRKRSKSNIRRSKSRTR